MKFKKLLLGLVILFVGFWLFTNPQGLADAIVAFGSQLWELTQQLFRALIKFFNALT
jgi:hypothetical protein